MDTGIYGPNLDNDRSFLWNELAGIQSCWDVHWCLGGEFNILRFPSESSEDYRLQKAKIDFSDFIS